MEDFEINEAKMAMSAEEIELEREKLEIEKRRLNLSEDVQIREVVLKEKQHGDRSISGAQATIAGAILALLSGWIGATITSSSSETISETNAETTLKIERTKVQGNLDLELSKQSAAENLARLEFETSLILGAIEDSSREEAIRNLRFFLAAGFVSDPNGKISSLQDNQLPSKAGPSPDDVLKAFEARVAKGGGSTPNMTAEVIYNAATDGTDTLRYHAGADAEKLLDARNKMDDAPFIGMVKEVWVH